MPAPVHCTNCGAPMNPAADNHSFACAYCGVRVQVAIGAEQLARGMALDLANIDAFLVGLARMLQQGMAEHSRIDADGAHIRAIEIDLEPDVFSVRREGHHAVAQHKKVVRGVALKNSTLPLDKWVEMLTHSLARHANTNARAAWVLGQLGGHR
jgi:predicted RNA-binding Zn-ribbon protein involved in translation (DUF1610 family)